MRHFALAVIVSLALAACGLPPNQPSVNGVVAYKVSTGEFWVNGKPLVLPPDVPNWGVRSGDYVNAYYEQQGDQRVVTRIDIVERFIFRF